MYLQAIEYQLTKNVISNAQYVESDQITYPAASGLKQSQKPNMGKWHLLHNQATHRNDEFLWKTSVVQIKHTLIGI